MTIAMPAVHVERNQEAKCTLLVNAAQARPSARLAQLLQRASSQAKVPPIASRPVHPDPTERRTDPATGQNRPAAAVGVCSLGCRGLVIVLHQRISQYGLKREAFADRWLADQAVY